jgi:hypothetical protein
VTRGTPITAPSQEKLSLIVTSITCGGWVRGASQHCERRSAICRGRFNGARSEAAKPLGLPAAAMRA